MSCDLSKHLCDNDFMYNYYFTLVYILNIRHIQYHSSIQLLFVPRYIFEHKAYTVSPLFDLILDS